MRHGFLFHLKHGFSGIRYFGRNRQNTEKGNTAYISSLFFPKRFFFCFFRFLCSPTAQCTATNIQTSLTKHLIRRLSTTARPAPARPMKSSGTVPSAASKLASCPRTAGLAPAVPAAATTEIPTQQLARLPCRKRPRKAPTRLSCRRRALSTCRRRRTKAPTWTEHAVICVCEELGRACCFRNYCQSRFARFVWRWPVPSSKLTTTRLRHNSLRRSKDLRAVVAVLLFASQLVYIIGDNCADFQLRVHCDLLRFGGWLDWRQRGLNKVVFLWLTM